MTRIPLVTRETATPEQIRVGDKIFTQHGEGFQGPSAALLQVPDVAELFDNLRDRVSRNSILQGATLQLASLVAARHWSNDFVFNVRVRLSKRAGIDAEIIEAIRHRWKPKIADPELAATYRYATELLGRDGPSQEAHDALRAFIGDDGMVEITMVIGTYCMLSLLSRAIGLPSQEPNTSPLER
jgi:4-carboxymuconolactone decarboxylase